MEINGKAPIECSGLCLRPIKFIIDKRLGDLMKFYVAGVTRDSKHLEIMKVLPLSIGNV